MLQRRTLTLSYRIPVIWGIVIVLALLGLISGWVVGRNVPAPQWALEAESPLLGPDFEGLAPEDADPEDVLGIDQRLGNSIANPEALIGLALLLQRVGDEQERALALATLPSEPEGDPLLGAICRTLIEHRGKHPPPDLLVLADSEPPPRWANRALGDFHDAYDQPEAAIERYAREGEQHAAALRSRRQAVMLANEIGATEALQRWAADPRWADALDPYSRFEIASAAGDWPSMLEWLLPMMYAHFEPALAVIAAVAALVYLFFLWHSSFGLPRRAELASLCLAAFALGVVSTWLTILILEAEQQLGLDRGSTPFLQAIYALRIGLREEFAKLLCFLPLAPLLVRRHGPLAWLLVASCVGAGFAAEENLNYYQQSLGSAVSGRFLTANFLHLTLTGLAGLALCQALRWPRQMAAHAGNTFLLVVIAHGLYDAFLMVDALRDFAWGYFIVFVLAGNAYFATLQQERNGPRPALSLTLVFCAGLTLVMAVAFVVLSAQYGSPTAGKLLFSGLLTSAIVVIMFVRGIGDRLSP